MSIKDWQIDDSWTLFLDRDGVINEREFGGYITTKEDFKFIPGVLEALSDLASVFNRLIIVTNQQGIGKEIMTERNLLAIHDYMISKIGKAGGRIDDVFFASNVRGASDDIRKPKPDMAILAKTKYPEIDFNKSIMIGDTDSDIIFGKEIGMKTVLVRSEEHITETPDLIVDSLSEFVNKLEK